MSILQGRRMLSAVDDAAEEVGLLFVHVAFGDVSG